MNLSLKNLFASNAVTIICSLIIGYSLWTMLTHNQIVQENIIIPVKIYQGKNIIDKETSINVLIEGARHQLKALINHPPQVNIYRDEQAPPEQAPPEQAPPEQTSSEQTSSEQTSPARGTPKQDSPEKPGNFIKISENDILLPETLSIINYWPREILL